MEKASHLALLVVFQRGLFEATNADHRPKQFDLFFIRQRRIDRVVSELGSWFRFSLFSHLYEKVSSRSWKGANDSVKSPGKKMVFGKIRVHF